MKLLEGGCDPTTTSCLRNLLGNLLRKLEMGGQLTILDIPWTSLFVQGYIYKTDKAKEWASNLIQ